ncbi:DUF305 domain-containing protein [Homoserinibacter sp. YIM 151385]|uniref:DUF305 domain-containing protein n=1 Tax=Homoserinibacter sp. YIM 151385 TaxID=2985506 RepID=UPI0022F020DE|nr:DUF305 domain-containing protein [Homoserinibacter sp. YIM 151385]WBU36924.1 DUF305 domain-containing protein [Homoserinibacter sp. YIM 151385]
MTRVEEAVGPDPETEPARGGGSGRLVLAAVLVTLVLVASAFVVGRISVGQTAPPTSESPAAGFLRDMQVHHAQAVEMSFIVRDGTLDEDVRRMAYDIATSQSNQAGQMYALLFSWDLPQASRQERMTWMTIPPIDGSGHEHEGGAHVPGEPMPGLATDAQLDRLRALEGADAERYFLELMLAHHRGGVEMADAIAVRTDQEKVLTLARSMQLAQTSEIDAMTEMLEERGGPLP